MRSGFVRRLFAVSALASLLLGSSHFAHAKLSSKEWKAAATQFEELFGTRGKAAERVEIMKTIAGDGSARAWKLMAEGLFLHVELRSKVLAELAQGSQEHAAILRRSADGYSAADGERVQALQRRIEDLEQESHADAEALDSILELVSQGSKDLRRHILKRAKPAADWTYRAAAARVAARTLAERPSASHLKKVFAKEADARVRRAGVEALTHASDGWEDLLLDRLADPDGSVVLAAAHVAAQRGLARAVSPILEAMDGASPHVARGLRRAARALAEAQAGPMAAAWSAWVAKNKGALQSPRICGLPIHSDRVIFLLDISVGMGKEDTGKGAGTHWRLEPPVEGAGQAPEPRIAGVPIDIAKHELKRAIQQLPPTATFNIVAFNQAAVAWERKMRPANEKYKESAYDWLRTLKPRGVSYTDGALRMAFHLAGAFEFGPEPTELAADTLVLISAGKTTDNRLPAAGLMDPKVILDHVRAWNRQQLLTLHCVAFASMGYMKTLAAEHGGVYAE